MGLFRYIMTKQFSKSVDKAIKSHGVVVKGLFFSKNKKKFCCLRINMVIGICQAGI